MAKVMISMSADLLAHLDSEAKRRKISRSGLIQRAAMHELGRLDPASLEATLTQARNVLTDVQSLNIDRLIATEKIERDRRDRDHL